MDNETVGEAVKFLRGPLSQMDLSKLMQERGFKWSQATVWNIERGERPLRFVEAIDLAEVLGTSLIELTGSEPADVASRNAAEVIRLRRKLEAAREALA